MKKQNKLPKPFYMVCSKEKGMLCPVSGSAGSVDMSEALNQCEEMNANFRKAHFVIVKVTHCQLLDMNRF